MTLRLRLLEQNGGSIIETNTIEWIILLAASVVLFFTNAHHARLNGDPLLYASEARQIAEAGEYATLRFGQELNHHGPLLFWLTAGAIKVFGPTPFAATFFSRLFGVGCVVLTAWLGNFFYGRRTGWFAALALATCYIFFRNTTTLRMDSALTFGILLAMVGYFRGEKWWGPPVFYFGIAVAVLAKSLPGFLPIFLAIFHALLDKNLHAPWTKQSRRWLYWAPLLLVPLAWWCWLFLRYGQEVLVVYVNDFLSPDGQPTDITRLYRSFKVYFLDFVVTYFPWIIFTGLGVGITVHTLRNSAAERYERATAGLLIGWIVVVIVAGCVKPAQYRHYLVPGLPAIAIITALAVVQKAKKEVLSWIPRTVALLTIMATFFSCVPMNQNKTSDKLLAMRNVLIDRLPGKTPVPILTLRSYPDHQPYVLERDRSGCIFFFGREPRPLTISDVNAERWHGGLVLLLSKEAFPLVAEKMNLIALVESDVWVLAEAKPPRFDQYRRHNQENRT